MSAAHFYKKVGPGGRAIGNALIAFGAILPGIGGGMAKAGMVEALYIGEFIGLLFIWLGYACCTSASLAGKDMGTTPLSGSLSTTNLRA